MITGGEVYAEGTDGAAAIGGGREGNCNGYYRPGSKVKGYDGGDHGVIIKGGKVTATATADLSGAVGIGGYKSDVNDPVMSVIITGGKVTATGNGQFDTGIGSGYYGVMKKIEISGGIVEAYGGSPEKNGGAAIGAKLAANGRSTNSFCESIKISGGTVTTGNSGKDGPGYIGGYENQSSTTWVCISGGNVYADIYKSDAHDPNDTSIKVYRNDISLKTYGLSSKYTEYVSVEGLTWTDEDGNTVDDGYGLNDVYTMPVGYRDDPVLHIWLPNGSALRTAETEDPYLEYGLDLRKEDIKLFTGLTETKSGGMLYPGFWFLIDDNYTAKDKTTDSAFLNIGDAKAEGDNFNPVVRTASDGTKISAAYYTIDKAKTNKFMNGDGTLVKSCSDDSSKWTDDEGRLIFTAASSGDDPRDIQDYYHYGIRLYSVWDKYILDYDANKPDTASTQMSGSMETAVYDYDTKVTIPECGYKLPGYKFEGWTLTKDPSEDDTVYQPGDEVKGTELDPEQTGKISLYAKWSAIEYTITFDSGDANKGTSTQEAVFDQPGELQANTWTYEGYQFHGWTAYTLGSFYDDEEDFCNLCALNDDGVPEGDTLTAEWIGNGTIGVSVTKDGNGVTGLSESFKLTDGSAEYDLPMTGSGSGTYLFDAAQLPQGKYSLEITDADYPVSDEAGTFEYDGTNAVSIVLDYYTVTVSKENDHISSAYLNTADTSSPETEMVVLDDTQLLLESEAVKGYHFDGYTAFGVTPGWDPKAAKQKITIKGKADITAYAEPNVYTVKYDANGGKGSMEDQDMVYDEAQRLFINKFTREGYVFRNWNTSKDPNTGTGFDNHALINSDNQDDLAPDSNGDSTTLYALWEPILYGITYDLDGGALPSGKNNPDLYTAEDAITLVNPAKTDYDFTGWTGTGLKTPTGKVTIPKGSFGDRTYKANWKLKQYTVKFVSNGGNNIASQTVEIHGQAVKPTDRARQGYTFAGWYSNKSLTERFDFSSKITADTVVYAKWKEKKYSGTLLDTMRANGSKALKLTWTKIDGVGGYDVFFARCNHDGKTIHCKKIASVKGSKTTAYKIKSLKKHTSYKAYVRAWVKRDGKKVYVRTSPMVHAYTGGSTKNCTNAKIVKVNKTKVSLEKGKNFKIKASVKKLRKNKKLMPEGHAPTLRYKTSNKKIAAVSKSGKITAKSEGTCYIYVYAHNGVFKQIKVTVE